MFTADSDEVGCNSPLGHLKGSVFGFCGHFLNFLKVTKLKQISSLAVMIFKTSKTPVDVNFKMQLPAVCSFSESHLSSHWYHQGLSWFLLRASFPKSHGQIHHQKHSIFKIEKNTYSWILNMFKIWWTFTAVNRNISENVLHGSIYTTPLDEDGL